MYFPDYDFLLVLVKIFNPASVILVGTTSILALLLPPDAESDRDRVHVAVLASVAR